MAVARETVDDRALEVQQRAVRLAQGVVGPFNSLAQKFAVGFAISMAIAAAVGTASQQPSLTAVVGIGLSIVVAVVAWAPLADARFRKGLELVYDHNCHEAAEWKAETGTSMPRGLPAVAKWLEANPTSRGRASLLLVVGRIEEADAAIAAIEPRTPAEAFDIELARQARTLLIGEAPDLQVLSATWSTLPDPREQRHRRECLAILEAEIAVGQGGDPMAVLAAARDEIPEVHWSMRTPALVAKWSLVAGLAIAVATILVSAFI